MKKKEIFEWLPVTVAKQFPSQLEKKKIIYEHGEFKERSEGLPASVNRIVDSLIIDMPLTQVKEYLQERMGLNLNLMMQDDILV